MSLKILPSFSRPATDTALDERLITGKVAVQFRPTQIRPRSARLQLQPGSGSRVTLKPRLQAWLGSIWEILDEITNGRIPLRRNPSTLQQFSPPRAGNNSPIGCWKMPFVAIRLLGGGLAGFGRAMLSSLRDLVPIIGVIAVFQLFVLRQPLDNFGSVMTGLGLVVVGLTLFVFGLEMGLFPIGEQLAQAFARKGSVPWLAAFAFSLGFGTTVAEPSLIAVAAEAARLTGGGEYWETGLRLTVAVAVGVALVIGVLRILLNWPIQWLIIGGYMIVMALTPFAPQAIVGVAYDSGGVTTSTITVPLTTALGVGLAGSIRGRNPLVDGFGLIALASLTPIVFVLVFGTVWPVGCPGLVE